MITPDLAELIALVDQHDRTPDEWDRVVILEKMRAEQRAIAARAPALARLAHVAVEGAAYVRRQATKKAGEHSERNVEMAAECIHYRRDIAFDGMSDIALIAWVGAQKPYGLRKSQARAAVLEGLRDPRNQEKIKQFGERGIPNKRRSIFNGTKELP